MVLLAGLVLSRRGRPGPRAQLVAGRMADEGGCGGGWIPAALGHCISGLGGTAGRPRADAQVQEASVLKEDDLRKEGMGGG